MTDWTRRARWVGVPLGAVIVSFLGCVGLCVGFPCFTTGLRYGVWAGECPAGRLRLGAAVGAEGLVRGGEGWVEVRPYARYVQGEGIDAWAAESTMYRGVSVDIELRDLEGKPIEGALEEVDRERVRGRRRFKVKLGALPDGDYQLHATVAASFETVEVDVPLALYAPAIAHVMTDRPLYKPGQEVLLRSVLLRRTDLTPLDGRPGRWRVVAPNGDEMLVERDTAGAYGVADSSFPLDSRAAVGTWSAIWESGSATDVASFEVRPFRLPRLTVEAAASASWYPKGEELVYEGKATYSSGAPVADAPVRMTLRVTDGRWPMPLEWEEPFTGRTDAYGRFRLAVGRVPPDLLERAEVTATVTVTEAAGESVVGSATAVLSEHDLRVEAVTELGDGLVGGFNNRAYLRVSTPDGRPLRDALVKVAPWWDAEAKPQESAADVDGVAALQIDPGDPITVVVEAPPYRPRPLAPAAAQIVHAADLSGAGLDLGDRRALDRVTDALGACGDFALADTDVRLGARVDRAGAVRRVMTGDSRAEQCVAKAIGAARFPAGPERTLSLTIRVPDSLRPWLTASTTGAWGDAGAAAAALDDAALAARRCLPREQGASGARVVALHWVVEAGSRAVQTTLGAVDDATGLPAGAEACARDAFRSVALAKPAEHAGMGMTTVSLSLPAASRHVPQDTTLTAYQLRVSAFSDGAKLGEAPLVLMPSAVPALRIRPTPTLARAGDTVSFELLRGPDFYAEIPDELEIDLYEGTVKIADGELDAKTRTVSYTIPDGTEGFVHVEWAGARGIVWVEPSERLSVAIRSDKPAYRPGETAILSVTTLSGDAPTAAGVGLSGVDATLAQLAPLPGPDAYGRVTVRATAERPAFGAFDPKALVLGQITGENAAKAAVLRLTTIPMDAAGDDRVYATAQTTQDDTEALTRGFYRALARLQDDVEAWEAAAPAGELLTNEKMAGMWREALRALRKEGQPAVDAFDRELTLDVLPADLLRQVDPRSVVGDATRLPEDVVAWERFVDEEVR